MRVAQWRKLKRWTQTRLADELGVTQPYVSGMERAVNPSIPGPNVMIELFRISGGAVQPNDFYDLPRLTSPQLEAA